jgi:transcription initiation factor TFIID/TFIIF subunit
MSQLSKVNLSDKEKDSYYTQQSYTYSGDDYWDWSVWIDSDNAEKLDNIVSVTYHLHNTFYNPVRVIKDRASKFRLDTSGWGTFRIYILINLKDKSVVELAHDLVLKYTNTALKDKKVTQPNKSVKKKSAKRK